MSIWKFSNRIRRGDAGRGDAPFPDIGDIVVVPSNGTSRGSPSTEDSDHQPEADDELMIKLKAETGYSCYVDFMKAYSTKHPYLEETLRSLDLESPTYGRSESHLTIIDLPKEGHSQPRVVPRCYSESVTSIVTSLRNPPANVAVQILLWNTGDYRQPHLVNALGLGLKIDPCYFENLPSELKPHWIPRHVTIDGAVATVTHRHNPDKLDAAPIVAIAGMYWELQVATCVEEEIGDIPHFRCPPVERHSFDTSSGTRVLYKEGDDDRLWEGLDVQNDEHLIYTRLLKWCLEKDEEPAVGTTDMFLQTLIPLFYPSIFRIRSLCETIRQDYYQLDNDIYIVTPGEDFISDLPGYRFRLRAMVEKSKDALDHFLVYSCSQKSADLNLLKSWRKAEEDLKTTHQEAARLEAQIRDYLQLQVGDLALQESKKSIELSNRQIEEGKRVKIFTVLAFVYIPLNLATSIFGMNLSELNGSGQKLWVFVITVAIALLITGASWYLIEEINNYLKWKERDHNTRMQFTMGERIGMLTFLWKKGHKDWMWKSGAWWRILTNSNYRLKRPEQAENAIACAYVWYNSGGTSGERSEAFKLDAVHERDPRSPTVPQPHSADSREV